MHKMQVPKCRPLKAPEASPDTPKAAQTRGTPPVRFVGSPSQTRPPKPRVQILDRFPGDDPTSCRPKNPPQSGLWKVPLYVALGTKCFQDEKHSKWQGMAFLF